MSTSVDFSVFTKPWKTLPLHDLAHHVRGLGFGAIELPVRPGFQVEPERAGRDMPVAQRTFADAGIRIASIAAEPTPHVIETCGRLGIPLIRVMAPIGADGYLATEARLRARYQEVAPILRASGVRLGVQNHSCRYVCHAMGLWRLLDGLDPDLFGAVWDPAHNALEGEEPDLALEIIGPRTFMVNLKNAFRRRLNGPEAEAAEWDIYWTSGRHGLASWPRVVELLRARSYTGMVCLPAEYSDEDAVDRLIVEDLHFARSLFASETVASRNATAGS